MADPEGQGSSPHMPPSRPQPPQPLERFRHVPDWETPANSRPRRQAFFSRLTAAVSERVPRLGRRSRRGRRQDRDSIPQFTGVGAAAASAGPTISSQQHEPKGAALEPLSLLTSPKIPPPAIRDHDIATADGVAGENTTKLLPPSPPATTLRARLQQRFDSLLPPSRLYLGRSRRKFLLFLLLPLLLLALLALILGLALGLSLRHRSAASYTQYLPQNAHGRVFSGDLTYFDLAVGACGYNNTDDQLVCAVSQLVFDAAGAESGTGANPNANPLCGMQIRVARGAADVDVTVVDRCVGCAAADVDLSPRAFDTVAVMSEGRVGGSWNWVQ